MNKDAITFDGVSAGYKHVEILKNISFTVPKGDFCGIIGPNGSGKTTLLRIITGLVATTSGQVSIYNTDVARIPSGERARLVGVVPQSMDTPMAFTVEEVVMIGRTASINRWGVPDKKDRLIAERAMVYTDVIDIRNKLFTELSGGERQRAVVAMVLAQQPEIILLDEATSHLDINHCLEVMQIVERLNSEEGTTVVMVSHDLNMAAEFCSHLLMLDKGSIHAKGTPSEVLNESSLRQVYECNISVKKDPKNGKINITPSRRLAPEHSGSGIRVHVIAGGGCGEELLRRLSLCDYSLTCGVLNEQDSDADVAAALGIETVLEKPFSPISSEAIEKAQQLIECTDVVILSDVPFGSGNLLNLRLAEKAIENGRTVLVMAGIDERDYTADKSAVSAVQQLIDKGAAEWNTLADLLNLLPHKEKIK